MPDEKERKIIRLEKRIEAMKMCGNCENIIIDCNGDIFCTLKTWHETRLKDYCTDWQLEEKI